MELASGAGEVVGVGGELLGDAEIEVAVEPDGGVVLGGDGE